MKHKIRKSGNETQVVDLTPIKAMRYFCVECMGHNPLLVDGCTDPMCPLYPYRNGKNPVMAGRKGNTKGLEKHHKEKYGSAWEKKSND